MLMLFKFNLPELKKSKLILKTFFWIPIIIVFSIFILGSDVVRITGFTVFLSVILYEYLRATRLKEKNNFLYPVLIIISFLHLPLFKILGQDITRLLIIIMFSTAMADIGAFFFGNSFGAHKLPEFVNPNKSWEGILGEIAGAFIGILLVKLFIIEGVNVLLFLPIGIGSGAGDMVNSYFKRKFDLKNWSNFIPGHGGFTDRFSSLAGSILFTFYFYAFLGH